MTCTITPTETGTAMDRICSTLQLTGMVWKRGSLLNNFLVLLSSLVLAGLSLACIVVWMIADGGEGYSLGFTMLINSYYTVMGVYAVIGSFTLGGLLEATLHLKLKLPIINAGVAPRPPVRYYLWMGSVPEPYNNRTDLSQIMADYEHQNLGMNIFTNLIVPFS